MKRQPTEWEKIFASHIFDKGMIYKVYKESYKSVTAATKQSSLSTARGTEYVCFQRRHTCGKQVHENMLNITNHQGNANQNHSEMFPHT